MDFKSVYWSGIIVIYVFMVSVIHGYPNGAPRTQDSCLNLQPIHTNPVTGEQFPNQEGPAPFRIELSTGVYQPCVMPIDCRRAPITVTIRGLSRYFRGFIIQARTEFGGAKSHGQFFPADESVTKSITCPNGQSLTQVTNTDKSTIQFQWIPEPNMKEPVRFVSTVVQSLRVIYTDVMSTDVTPVGLLRQTNQQFNFVRPPSSGPRQMFILQPSPQQPFDYPWRNQEATLSLSQPITSNLPQNNIIPVSGNPQQIPIQRNNIAQNNLIQGPLPIQQNAGNIGNQRIGLSTNQGGNVIMSNAQAQSIDNALQRTNPQILVNNVPVQSNQQTLTNTQLISTNNIPMQPNQQRIDVPTNIQRQPNPTNTNNVPALGNLRPMQNQPLNMTQRSNGLIQNPGNIQQNTLVSNQGQLQTSGSVQSTSRVSSQGQLQNTGISLPNGQFSNQNSTNIQSSGTVSNQGQFQKGDGNMRTISSNITSQGIFASESVQRETTVITTKSPTTTSSTTQRPTTRTPILLTKSPTKLNFMGSNGNTPNLLNNLPVVTPTNNVINMEAKPKNSAYRGLLSGALVFIPLLMLLL